MGSHAQRDLPAEGSHPQKPTRIIDVDDPAKKKTSLRPPAQNRPARAVIASS
jgi:hypothetical protein